MAFVDQFPKEDVTYKGAKFQGDWEKESENSKNDNHRSDCLQ